MAKILGIIGSLRADSINRAIFNHYAAMLTEHEVTEGEIGDIPHYNTDEQDPFPESVIKLAAQIRKSDGLIFFSPEYNYSIPGVLKNAIDWISRLDDQPFNNKPCAIIGASPGAVGTARMQYHLRQVAVFLNLHVMNKPEVMINGSFDKVQAGQLTDSGTIEFLQKHSQAFLSFIEKTQIPTAIVSE